MIGRPHAERLATVAELGFGKAAEPRKLTVAVTGSSACSLKKIAANAQAMQESLRVGTPVMLTSGIHATVAALGESTVDVEISPGVVMTVARPAIMEVRTTAADPAPGTPGRIDGDGDPTDPTR